MPLELLQATDNYIIIAKQAGVSFHSTGKKPGVMQILRKMEEDGLLPGGDRLYPVHRLDELTSGIILFARGRKNAEILGNAFRHSRVEKFYIALSDRRPKQKQGTIIGDMVRSRRSSWKLTRDKKNPAVTEFKSRTLGSDRPLVVFLVRPKTGKTHQIRVALKSVGSPVLGDPLYGRFDRAREEDRAYLHACAIRLKLENETISCVNAPSDGREFLSPSFVEFWKKNSDPFKWY